VDGWPAPAQTKTCKTRCLPSSLPPSLPPSLRPSLLPFVAPFSDLSQRWTHFWPVPPFLPPSLPCQYDDLHVYITGETEAIVSRKGGTEGGTEGEKKGAKSHGKWSRHNVLIAPVDI